MKNSIKSLLVKTKGFRYMSTGICPYIKVICEAKDKTNAT